MSDSDFVPNEEDYYEKGTGYINDKIISAKFGDYYNLPVPKPKTASFSACCFD